MKKSLFLITLFTFSLLKSNVILAGEITDMEFNIIDRLVVTYYKGSNGRVDCTAYNSKNKPIGGGFNFASGGVARVSIEVPKKYVRKKLSVSCE